MFINDVKQKKRDGFIGKLNDILWSTAHFDATRANFL